MQEAGLREILCIVNMRKVVYNDLEFLHRKKGGQIEMEKIARRTAVILCELTTIATCVMLISKGIINDKLLLAVVTILLVLAPELLERICKCRMWTPLYVFCVLYSIGPMLGHTLDFYTLIPHWDKILHVTGGVVFAIVGIFLFQLMMGKDTRKVLATAVFALCFSMALSMLWEFYEFGSDCLLGTDTQADTVVTSITSHLFSDVVGDVGTISQIETVTINGQTMDWGGYLDIGLHDTMMDMIWETLGAAAVAVLYLLDRGKHPLIRFHYEE